jgi:hypothetical protein
MLIEFGSLIRIRQPARAKQAVLLQERFHYIGQKIASFAIKGKVKALPQAGDRQ